MYVPTDLPVFYLKFLWLGHLPSPPLSLSCSLDDHVENIGEILVHVSEQVMEQGSLCEYGRILLFFFVKKASNAAFPLL